MLGYGVFNCACICELAPSATTSMELANPIILNILRLINSPLRRGFWADQTTRMRPFHLRVATDHTDEYVCYSNKSQRWEGLRGLIAGENSSRRKDD